MSNGPHYDRVRDLVTEYTYRWVGRMGIEHWQIEVVFLETELAGEPVEGDFRTAAETEAMWQYQRAKIKWSLPSASRSSDVELEGVVVHELVHVLLSAEQQLLDVKVAQVSSEEPGQDADRIQGLYSERMEFSTELVTQALLAAYSDINRARALP